MRNVELRGGSLLEFGIGLRLAIPWFNMQMYHLATLERDELIYRSRLRLTSYVPAGRPLASSLSSQTAPSSLWSQPRGFQPWLCILKVWRCSQQARLLQPYMTSYKLGEDTFKWNVFWWPVSCRICRKIYEPYYCKCQPTWTRLKTGEDVLPVVQAQRGTWGWACRILAATYSQWRWEATQHYACEAMP